MQQNFCIVDDHPLMRKGIRILIEGRNNWKVAYEFSDGNELIELLKKEPHLFLILDISLNCEDGLTLIKKIREQNLKNHILILSMYDEITHGDKALSLGANGYLMKEDSSEKLEMAIEKVLSGGVWASEKLAQRVLKKITEGVSKNFEDLLTVREWEIFKLLGEGKTSSEMAEKLQVSKKTINSYKENLKDKLNIENTNKLIRESCLYFSQNITEI